MTLLDDIIRYTEGSNGEGLANHATVRHGSIVPHSKRTGREENRNCSSSLFRPPARQVTGLRGRSESPETVPPRCFIENTNT